MPCADVSFCKLLANSLEFLAFLFRNFIFVLFRVILSSGPEPCLCLTARIVLVTVHYLSINFGGIESALRLAYFTRHFSIFSQPQYIFRIFLMLTYDFLLTRILSDQIYTSSRKVNSAFSALLLRAPDPIIFSNFR